MKSMMTTLMMIASPALLSTAAASTDLQQETIAERATRLRDGFAATAEAVDALAFVDARLRATLPDYDQSLLAAVTHDGAWIKELSIEEVAAAMGDAAPSEVRSLGSMRGAGDQSRAIRVDEEQGLVEYLSRERRFQFETSPHVGVGRERALGATFEALEMLEAPLDQGEIIVDVAQVAMKVAPIDRSSEPIKAIRSTLVTIERLVRGVPVNGSMIRASISNEGKIAKLSARWPRFQVDPELTLLRGRDQVIADAAARIVAQDTAPLDLLPSVVFVPGTRGFVPALEVMVRATEENTSFSVVVPLAGR